MGYTLLHISDLHRSSTDPISNDELLSSLVADRDRYLTENPAVRSPDAIVVSGDLIQGAPLGEPQYPDRLAEQYEVAHDFLAALCDEFIAGDRSRIVVIPGNHDVDWNMAFASMHELTGANVPLNLSASTFVPRSNLRWDWERCSVFRIDNEELYAHRLEAFRGCADRFYGASSSPARRGTSAESRVFQLAGGEIAVAAFNSCFGNDCFARHGAIDGDAVARAHMEMKSLLPTPRLFIAVWHHNVSGPPYASDYMDDTVVRELIGKGFRLGLHGHNHRSQTNLHYIYLPDEEIMAVVGAGSVCAGRYALPSGVNRQYNLIELNETLDGATVHVREMVAGKVFGKAIRPEFGGKSYVKVRWQLPANTPSAIAADRDSLLVDAERALREGRVDDAIATLGSTDRSPGSFARRLMQEALKTARRWDELVLELGAPATAADLVEVVTTLGDAGRITEARTLLQAESKTLGLADATEDDLLRWLVAKETLGG
jgi:Calcineurin-like phosphoesterase